MDDLKNVIKSSPFQIVPRRYAVVQVEKVESIADHFMVSKDETEITVITEEKNLSGLKIVNVVKWFKIIEIKMSAPFKAPGFLAAISGSIADKGINIFIISTFSKDYVLLKEEDLDAGVEALISLGFEREAYP